MILIDDIKKFATRLQSASEWHSSKEAITHVESSIGDKGKKSDYVYEFYVLMSLLDNLKSNYHIRYLTGENNNHKFPKKGGLKKNFPRFHACDKLDAERVIFQICPGTKVLDKYDHHVHPDISFQKPEAGLDPSGKDLVMVIDAKHKVDLDSRITSDEVNGFAHSVKCFEIDKNGIAIEFSAPLDILINNAIITNGRPHLDYDRMLADYNCIVIFNFYPTKSFQVVR